MYRFSGRRFAVMLSLLGPLGLPHAWAGCDEAACSAQSSRPSSDPDRRAERLVAQMTLDEKIQLVHGDGFGSSPLGGGGYIPGVPRLRIPDINSTDGTGGVTVVGSGSTALPSPLALAAAWDPGLAYEHGALVGREARQLGFVELLGGGINLAREPRGGRTFEYFGEDPLLAGTLAARRTEGVQNQRVISTIKHYALNSQETNRFDSNSQADERTMRELYLLGFEIAVRDGRPGNLMCAYNLVNGIKSCQHPELLSRILKADWGFQGTVQSDWGFAVTDTVAAANAGLDEEQPGAGPVPSGFDSLSHFTVNLKSSVESGAVPAARLDDMVRRKLRSLYVLGIMDAPPVGGGSIDRVRGNAFAREVAEQSMVLLKNAPAGGTSPSVLPLDARSLRSIVVIGGNAESGVISGGGSASAPAHDGNAVACQTPSATIGNLGFFSACATWYKSAPLDAIRLKAPAAAITFYDGRDAAVAAAAAAAADVAIIFATQWQTEDADLPSLSLPDATADAANQTYDQNALISAIAAKAKRSVVVLETGSAVTMPWIDSVDAVLEAWYPGVQGGAAIANVLFGEVNPSGKLPLSFPRSEADLPQKHISATETGVVYREGLNMGYRWYDSQGITPLFPFGHGLSYSRFRYADLEVRRDKRARDARIELSFSLKNTSERAGSEVAQIYLELPVATGEPPKRLVAWEKLHLQPGESKRVKLHLDSSSTSHPFSYWSFASSEWKIAQGRYQLYVGSSSRDIRLSKTLHIDAR